MNSNLFVQFTAYGRAISFSVDWNESAEEYISINLRHSRCWRVNLGWSWAITAKVVWRMTISCTNDDENAERYHKSKKNGRFLNKRHCWPKSLANVVFVEFVKFLRQNLQLKKDYSKSKFVFRQHHMINGLTSPAQFSGSWAGFLIVQSEFDRREAPCLHVENKYRNSSHAFAQSKTFVPGSKCYKISHILETVQFPKKLSAMLARFQSLV